MDGFYSRLHVLQNLAGLSALFLVPFGGDEEVEVNELVVHSEEGICNVHGSFLIPWARKGGVFVLVILCGKFDE